MEMTMTNVDQIRSAILTSSLSNEDLNNIIDVVKFVRTQLGHNNIKTIRIGSTVKFTSRKTGKNITGTVTKIGRKNLIVRENGMSCGNWRVPANMVEVI